MVSFNAMVSYNSESCSSGDSFLIMSAFGVFLKNNRIQKSNAELTKFISDRAAGFTKLREEKPEELTLEKIFKSSNPLVKEYINFAIGPKKLEKVEKCWGGSHKGNKENVKKSVKRLQQVIQTALDKHKRRK